MKPSVIIKEIANLRSTFLGRQVPLESTGEYIEQEVASFLKCKLNTGAGPDLPMGVEIKSRCVNASSAQTICRMKSEDIISTDYDSSPVKKKFLQQLRVHYTDFCTHGIITDIGMYNFSHSEIQAKMRDAYESARAIFISIKANYKPDSKNPLDYGNYIRKPNTCGYFERTLKNSPNSYEFRLPDGVMRQFEAYARSSFSSHFEFC